MTLPEKTEPTSPDHQAQKLETMTREASHANLSFAAALERLAIWNWRPATAGYRAPLPALSPSPLSPPRPVPIRPS